MKTFILIVHMLVSMLPVIIFFGLVIGDVYLYKYLISQLPVDMPWVFWGKSGIIFGFIIVTSGLILWFTSKTTALYGMIFAD